MSNHIITHSSQSCHHSFVSLEPTDYVDEGGNIANGNICNGSFVSLGQQCIAFLDIIMEENAESAQTPPRPVSQKDIANPVQSDSTSLSCERPISNQNACINIGSSYESLKNLIEGGAGQMVFCPFTVEKSAQDFIFITSDIEVMCSVPRECKIKGQGRHLVVNGSSAKLFLQGFVLEGASSSAIHVEGATAHIQSLCNNDFIGNKGSARGLGLLAEWRTIIEVSHCRFIDCQSTDMGGAIFNRGVMLIENSLFQSNHGRGAR